MLKQILLVFFISVSSFCSAQNKELLKSYTKSELSKFSKETILILEYGINNAVYLIDLPSEKEINLPEIELTENTLKYTDLGLKILRENQYYKIKNSNSMLVVKSQYVLNNELIHKKKKN